MIPDQRERVVDLIVIGTGAGGLTAALAARAAGLDVLVIEKHTHYGGSSAMSGGVVWVPNNHLSSGSGREDSPAAALAYLRRFESDPTRDRRLVRFVRDAPEMARFLSDNGVPWLLLPDYPDYFEGDGHRAGGRALCPAPLDGQALGEHFQELRPVHPQMSALGTSGIIERSDDVKRVGSATLKARLLATWRLCRWIARWPAHLRLGRDPFLTLGAALVGHLRRALAAAGIPVWLSSPARELLCEGGRVVGARVETPDGVVTVRASLGVVLASGGFERSDELRARFLPQPSMSSWSAAHPANTGDSLLMAEACGAKLEHADAVLWCTTTTPPGASLAWPLIVERCAPGCILVDRSGRRFVAESSPFAELGAAFHDDPSLRIPSFLVFDRVFRRRFPVGPLLPALAVPDWVLSREISDEYLVKARSWAELERKLGIPAGALAATVERFNSMVSAGRDEDFHTGESSFARCYSLNATRHGERLAALARPPFYAVRVFPGDLGTIGGIATDEDARVVDSGGQAIPGLYAVGNCASPLVSKSYVASGITLGAAMTSGFVAGRHAATEQSLQGAARRRA